MTKTPFDNGYHLDILLIFKRKVIASLFLNSKDESRKEFFSKEKILCAI